jgi:hypothetical protein
VLLSTHAPGPKVQIYQPLSAQITTSPAIPTEGKSFDLRITIANPTGVAVSNVFLSLPIPSGLTLSQLQGASLAGGALTVSASSLSPHSTLNATAVGVASSGITVPFSQAKFTFIYGGVTVNGKLPSQGIAIGEDVTTRYLLPTGLVLLALLATAYYMRRKVSTSAPASQS